MTKNDIQKLGSCITLLEFYEKPFRESFEDGGQMEDPPGVMLQGGETSPARGVTRGKAAPPMNKAPTGAAQERTHSPECAAP